MTKSRHPNFSPEFRLDDAKLVLELHYSVVEAAKALGVVDKWKRQLRSE